ncbi:MAG: hypothetical protein IJ574_05260 [Bacilli bacterium]|nr:hypothetical protein [Bacilli bacterium]
MILTDEETLKLNGGAIKTATIAAITAVGIFLAGLFDGLFRPLRCN